MSTSEVIHWKALAIRQRDALIAEKVMGKRVEHWTEEDCEGHELRTGYVLPDQFGSPPVPCYSTNISAAWEVVREVNKPLDYTYDRYAAFVNELEKIVGSDMFYDLFYCDVDGDHLTAERLCIAALRAYGIEVVL